MQLPINNKVSWGINGKTIEGVSITSDSGDMVRQNMSREDGINGPIIFQGSLETFRTITLRCLGKDGLDALRSAVFLETGNVISQIIIDLNGSSGTYYYWDLQESNNSNALDVNNSQIYYFTLTLTGAAPLGTIYVIP